MLGSRQFVASLTAALTLAMALHLPCQHAIASDGFAGENSLRAAAWSPNRDEAVVVENLPGAIETPDVPADSVLNHSLLMKRPKSLSRPAPGRMRTASTPATPGAEVLPAPAITPMSPEGLPVPPVLQGELGDEFIDGSSAYGDGCCTDCCGNWRSCGPVPPCCLLPRISWEAFELFGGVQAFTGPLNRGGSGSFGFHEGFNWGIPVFPCVAWQWGVNWVQSNYDGSALTPDERNQIFLTAGLFRRVDWGLQGGLVVDYLHDEWDYTADLVQLRGELSWVFCGTDDVGVWFTAGVNDQTSVALQRPVFGTNNVTFRTTNTSIDVNNLFAFFYRRQFCCGGNGRIYGGFTGAEQGLVGGDIMLPISPCWSLRSNFLYIVPNHRNSSEPVDFIEETWNVGVSLVWSPCPRSLSSPNYCRPLFNVADNGTFATTLVP